jgi:tetratricopeptide (TPR) repeat protein
MIVKDEEANLADCLRSAADVVDEIVVVDTGSTDRTRDIARGFGARVHDFPWVDSFAAARNETLRHATGEWSLRLDADDRLDEDNRRRLRDLFAGLKDEVAGYVVNYLSLAAGGTGAATVIEDVRLFRNHPAVRWQYRIHEQILPALERAGGVIRRSDVVIQTVGYQDPAVLRRKQERNLRLLLMENAEHPDDPYMLFHLGWNYVSAGQTRQGLPFLKRSLGLAKPGDRFVPLAYCQLARGYYQAGQRPEALQVCRQGQRFFPEQAELVFLESILLGELGDLRGSENCLLRLVQPGARFHATDPGLCGYKARQNLGVLYGRQKRFVEAEAQWKAVLAEQSGLIPAWLALADLWLAQGRPADLEQAVRGLQNTPRAEIAVLLQARAHQARKEFAAARALLERAMQADPQAPWPPRLLQEVARQERGG